MHDEFTYKHIRMHVIILFYANLNYPKYDDWEIQEQKLNCLLISPLFLDCW